jgi:hypothetical protein
VVATAAAGADLVVEQLLVLLQAENRSAPRPGAMRADLRSSCPLLPVVDRSVPGVRGPTAAQTGQQMVRQVRPGSPAIGLVGSPKDAVARPGPGPADRSTARPVCRATRHRPTVQELAANVGPYTAPTAPESGASTSWNASSGSRRTAGGEAATKTVDECGNSTSS